MRNFDRGTSIHEAGHAVVAEALGAWGVALVRSDGSGQADTQPSRPLSDDDRAAMAVAGQVAECLLIGGDLRRAVCDTLNGGQDGDNLRAALRSVPAYRRDAAALGAAKRAWQILSANRERLNELTASLQEHGVARIGQAPAKAPAARTMPPSPPRTTPGPMPMGRAGRGMTKAELRSAADDAERAGHLVKARLMRASADGRREPGVERRVLNDPKSPLIGGPEYSYKE